MQTSEISETPCNPLQHSNRLSHAIPSQYPWLGNTSHALASKPAEWLTETSEITLPNALLSEEDVRPQACAAWAIVLAQYTGREDACFGILSREGNGQSLIEALMIDCESTLTVSGMVKCAKSLLKPVYKNASTHCRDIGVLHNCLAFTTLPTTETINVDNLCLSPLDGIPLVLCLTRKEQFIFLRAHFDSNVVTRQEIGRAMGHFSKAFRHVISPKLQSSAIGSLDLFTPEDMAQLREWNSHDAEPVNNLLHILFEEAAKANQGKPALLYCLEIITYEELDNMSSNLALQILQADDSPGDYIPICIVKSPEMIIAMIAVLKANKAFVPVDPAYPRAHRDQILASLQSKMVLVSEGLHGFLPSDSGVKELIVRASTLKRKGMHQTTHSQAGIDPARPAYILFTSGSTGIPKGVVVEHRNVCASMKELGRQFDLDSDTRMFQYTSFTFDPSILEIFGTLIHGGCVCVPTERERLNDIPKAMNEMQVTTAVFVPSVLKLLRPEEIPTVKKLIIGGEKLTPSLIDLWADRTHLINAYGPTETCVCSLANLRVSPGRFGGNIGTSIACRAWVVNPNNKRQLAPIGAIGELWIQGPTVAREYIRDEAATKASFASSLPWINNGAINRAYRTGDLVRYLPDGKLLFLGRKDKQVKLNGHRVELEEIEVAICGSPFVADASVQLLDFGGSAILAVFFIPECVARQGEDCSHPLSVPENILLRLRDDLREQLQAPMVPEYLIPVNSIPRMTSGKVDQRHLIAIFEQFRLNQYQSRHGKRNKVDQEVPESYRTLRNLWAEVLEIAPSSISSSDRFLHLGGNSIKAMKLVAASRDSCIVLTVDEVLKNCTLDELNRSRNAKPATVKTARSKPQFQSLPPRSYTPTWIQMVSLTTVSAFPEGNYTRIVIDLRGNLDIPRLSEACRSLTRQNEILRTQYSFRDSTIEATIIDEVEVPLLRFNSRSEAVDHWESIPPTCLDQQLVEFSYVVMSENSTHFALGLQHSQYDAWTVPLLLRQLQSIYHGYPVSPGPSFSAYAVRLALETNPEAERFWKGQLADLPMTLLGNGSSEGDEPDGHLRQSLRPSLSQFTFATIIYTAWALVLSKRADTRRVVFGGAVSGRTIDMEGILDVVGPCINMVPFAVDVAECVTYLDALQTVQNGMMATVPYEAMPLPDIITRCTKWNPTDLFGSIVHHLDINFDIPPLSQARPSRDPETLDWKYLEMRKQYGKCRATDIYIFSTTSRDGSADVQLKFNPSRVRPDLTEVLFNELCGHILAAMETPAQDILDS